MDIAINLIINGLATGMLLFLLAAGLTLIFGLMHVLNFAHGGLFVWAPMPESGSIFGPEVFLRGFWAHVRPGCCWV